MPFLRGTRYAVGASGGAAAPAFTPASLPNLLAWFDPSYGVYSDAGTTPAVADDPVYRWVSRNSATIYFEQATLANRPIYKQGANGKWYVQPSDTGDLMTMSGFSIGAATSLSWATSMQFTTSNSGNACGQFFGDSTDTTFFNFADGNTYDDFGSTTRKSFAGPDWTSFQSYIVNSASGEWTAYANGTQLYTTGANTVAGPPAGQRWFQKPGQQSHMVFTGSTLDADQRLALHTYFTAERPT